jgi:hypothetical protein
MPEQINGEKPAGNPDSQTPPPPPVEPTIEKRIVALEAERDSRNNRKDSNELAAAVKTGERWLIGINGIALLVSIGIGIVYIFQLREMRKSTDAATSAAYTASQSLQMTRTLVINEDQPVFFMQAEGGCSATNLFRVSFRNHGKTDALGVTGTIHAGIWVTSKNKMKEISSLNFGGPGMIVDSDYPFYEWIKFTLPDCVPNPKSFLEDDSLQTVRAEIKYDNGFGELRTQNMCVFFWNGNWVECSAIRPLWEYAKSKDNK